MRDFFYIGEGRAVSGGGVAREPAINAPFVVLLLIGLLVGVHILRSLLAPEFNRQLVFSFAFIPVRLSQDEFVPQFNDVVFLLGPAGRWITIVSHVFLQANYLQLALNCVWLLAAGAPVARRIGQVRFVLFFTLCAVAGALAYFLKETGSPVPYYGSAAACAGLMGGAVRFAFSQSLVESGPGSVLSWPARLALPLTSLFDLRVLGFAVLWTLLIVGLGLGGVHIFGDDYSLAWEAYLASFFAGLVFLPYFDPHRPLSA